MIKYKKASIILTQVAEDLSSYDDAGQIDPTKFYKILRRCNATLGLKLNPEKQAMVTVKNFKARLPEDFTVLNFAFLCQVKKINVTLPSGFHIELQNSFNWKLKDGSCCLFEKQFETVIIQKCEEKFQEFSKFDIVRVTSNSSCTDQCPNFFSRSTSTITVKDGWIITNFRDGDLYLDYVGSMEDEDGDLLVLDDPNVEAYYEASVINQFFKLLYRNKEQDVQQLYLDSVRDLERTKISAIKYVNMPEYTEVRDLFQAQRIRLWNKYFLPIAGWS